MHKPPSAHLLTRAALGGPEAGPLHGQVRLYLRETIEEHFEDGQSFWTERLLIERLGIARGTLRQALDELTREGLLLRENSLHRMVRKVGVTSIGMVFPQFDSDFLVELLQRVGAVCVERNLHFELYPTMHHGEVSEVLDKIRRSPQQERLLVLTDKDRYEALVERGYHVVAFEEYEPNRKMSTIVTDVEVAVRLAFEHLRELGHKRIVFLVNEPPERESVKKKIREFERLLGEYGISEGKVVVCGHDSSNDSFNRAYKAMPGLWGAKPTAIFTASDPGAWAALRWLAQYGVKVPEEVSVIGFENVKPDAFTHPPLTSVGHSFDELARQAIELLWQREVKHVTVAPTLVVRESTGQCFEKSR